MEKSFCRNCLSVLRCTAALGICFHFIAKDWCARALGSRRSTYKHLSYYGIAFV